MVMCIVSSNKISDLYFSVFLLVVRESKPQLWRCFGVKYRFILQKLALRTLSSNVSLLKERTVCVFPPSYQCNSEPCGLVSIGWTSGELGFFFLRVRRFICAHLRPGQILVPPQWLPGTLCVKAKYSGPEAIQSTPSSADCQERLRSPLLHSSRGV